MLCKKLVHSRCSNTLSMINFGSNIYFCHSLDNPVTWKLMRNYLVTISRRNTYLIGSHRAPQWVGGSIRTVMTLRTDAADPCGTSRGCGCVYALCTVVTCLTVTSRRCQVAAVTVLATWRIQQVLSVNGAFKTRYQKFQDT